MSAIGRRGSAVDRRASERSVGDVVIESLERWGKASTVES